MPRNDIPSCSLCDREFIATFDQLEDWLHDTALLCPRCEREMRREVDNQHWEDDYTDHVHQSVLDHGYTGDF